MHPDSPPCLCPCRLSQQRHLQPSLTPLRESRVRARAPTPLQPSRPRGGLLSPTRQDRLDSIYSALGALWLPVTVQCSATRSTPGRGSRLDCCHEWFGHLGFSTTRTGYPQADRAWPWHGSGAPLRFLVDARRNQDGCDCVQEFPDASK